MGQLKLHERIQQIIIYWGNISSNFFGHHQAKFKQRITKIQISTKHVSFLPNIFSNHQYISSPSIGLVNYFLSTLFLSIIWILKRFFSDYFLVISSYVFFVLKSIFDWCWHVAWGLDQVSLHCFHRVVVNKSYSRGIRGRS